MRIKKKDEEKEAQEKGEKNGEDKKEKGEENKKILTMHVWNPLIFEVAIDGHYCPTMHQGGVKNDP